jgi:glutamyl-tRNA synthetase
LEPTVFDPNPHTNWRFRIAHQETVAFADGRLGLKSAVAGRDFGDFLVWRKDGVPSYQLACTVDDALMEITEVVRGEDLVTSTFRQLLLFHALGHQSPHFYHCPLLTDANGKRLAKRDDSISIKTLREQGHTPESIRHLIASSLAHYA